MPDVGLVELAGGRHRLVDPLQHRRVVERHVEQQALGGLPQAPHVPVVEERDEVIRAQRLVDPLAIDEPVVVDRHHGLVGRGDLPVDVNRSTHRQ